MICPEIKVAEKVSTNGSTPAPALGQRATRQRKLIFDILMASPEHLDVESLYQKARNIDSRVSLSTVYRTISLLKESDLVDELVFEDDRRFYEAKKSSRHHHVRCLSCSEIIEFESKCSERLREALQDQLGFQVESLRIDVAGYCSKCRPG